LDSSINDEWLIWRVWLNKGGNPNDYRNNYTYDDLLKIHALLDWEDAIECGLDGIREE
jgi:hypothetical protein